MYFLHKNVENLKKMLYNISNEKESEGFLWLKIIC